MIYASHEEKRIPKQTILVQCHPSATRSAYSILQCMLHTTAESSSSILYVYKGGEGSESKARVGNYHNNWYHKNSDYVYRWSTTMEKKSCTCKRQFMQIVLPILQFSFCLCFLGYVQGKKCSAYVRSSVQTNVVFPQKTTALADFCLSVLQKKWPSKA